MSDTLEDATAKMPKLPTKEAQMLDAANRGNVAQMKELLAGCADDNERNALKNTQNALGTNPLFNAAPFPDAVEFLLSINADYRAKSASGRSVLHETAPYPESLKLVLEREMRDNPDYRTKPETRMVNQPDGAGDTPLHVVAAVEGRGTESGELMLLAGATPDPRNNLGRPPGYLAKIHGKSELKDMLDRAIAWYENVEKARSTGPQFGSSPYPRLKDLQQESQGWAR